MTRSIRIIRLSFLIYISCVFFFYLFNMPIRFLFIDSLLAYFPVEIYFMMKRTSKKYLLWGLAPIYILFLPNNAYLLTDLIHLSRITFYTKSELIMTEDSLSWLMFSLVIIGVFSLIYAGFQTEFQLLTSVRKKNAWSRKFFIFVQTVLFFIISIGVFLGRFIRFNSISIFTETETVFRSFSNVFTMKSLIFIVLFTFVQFILYGVLIFGKSLFNSSEPD